ncbi:MAG TPA: SGNH/GDSL hydrolase family protein [Anaerolineae bacterium]
MMSKGYTRQIWKFLGLLLVNIVIIMVLLYGFETYLRLTDPFIALPFDTYYYESHRSIYRDLNPPDGEYTWGHSVETNRLGFRERNFEVPKPAGLCRIMVLGDSLTWGAGLASEERYTDRVGMILNETFTDRTFEVVNFGVSGAPTTIERDILRDYKDLINPDLVVIGFVYNDPQPRSQGYRVEREQFYQQYGHLLSLPPQGLIRLGLYHTADITRKALDNVTTTIGLFPPWEVGVQRTYDSDSAEWRDFRQALQDIKAMSDEMNLPSPIFAVLNSDIFLDHPTSLTAPADTLPIYLRWYHQAEQTATELGFRTYNHEQEFAEQLTPDEIEVNQLDAHPSAGVNLVYGQKLFDLIAADVRQAALCQPASSQMPQPSLEVPLANKRLMRIRVGDQLRFLGYAVDSPQLDRGETLQLTFGWQALAKTNDSYLIRSYLLSSAGDIQAEQIGLPCHGDCPTSQWPAGLVAPPGTSTIYWPASAELSILPFETVFKQGHLAYRDRYREAIEIVPIPIRLAPFPGSLVDLHEISLHPELPAGEYTLALNVIDPKTGNSVPAYDEVAQRFLPEAQIVLGQLVLP